MGFHYVVLGSGRQGVALAYDLAKNCEADRVTLADIDVEITRQAILRLESLLPKRACELAGVICDVTKPAEVAMTITGADVVLSAAPYRFNVELTDAAIAAGASFLDLGGNTQVVRLQLKRHERAADAGVSIVPDCGLAPGLGNTLAAHGIGAMDTPEHAHIRCGGLPQERIGPLGYKMAFNFDGLINEYSGHAEFIRDGKRIDVDALSELEQIEFSPPVGKCEAAVTTGGTSTCAETFAGRVRSYDYKTVRYPGHFAIIRAMFDLGCFENHVILPDGEGLEPKDMLQRLFESRLVYPEIRDLVILRTTVTGKHEGQPCTRRYELYDRHDEATGFTAMERTTAFPAALVAYMQARREVAPGARPLEIAVPPGPYLEELSQHDIRVDVSAD